MKKNLANKPKWASLQNHWANLCLLDWVCMVCRSKMFPSTHIKRRLCDHSNSCQNLASTCFHTANLPLGSISALGQTLIGGYAIPISLVRAVGNSGPKRSAKHSRTVSYLYSRPESAHGGSKAPHSTGIFAKMRF